MSEAPPLERAYCGYAYRPSELSHLYGPNVHLLAEPVLLTQLARLSAQQTQQPAITTLVRDLYRSLGQLVLAAELPREPVQVPTRMAARHPGTQWHGEVLAEATKVVTVGVARAGTLPSQVLFELLLQLLRPEVVRQDHLFMNRVTGPAGNVTDVAVAGNKIGGDIADAFVMVPDPMGATGSSLARAVSIYKALPGGSPKRIVALNLIVTPEYLAHLRQVHPDVVVYAVRLDRGSSSPNTLQTQLGECPHDERGLDAFQYIVPGAGGLGEILNNSFV